MNIFNTKGKHFKAVDFTKNNACVAQWQSIGFV